MTTIIKLSKVSDDEIPKPDDIAAYVESLKLYLHRNQVKDESLMEQIENLPSPNRVLKLSIEEIRVLTETVGYLWKKIANSDIIEESKMKRAPETLMGNYLIISKGIILSGQNHYTIIKQNINLIQTLLNINPFAMHDKLSGNPRGIIKLVLDYGAIRVYVSKTKEAYFQLSDKTYSEWGKNKIRKYEFNKKVIRIIDSRQPYSGWKTGISIRLI